MIAFGPVHPTFLSRSVLLCCMGSPWLRRNMAPCILHSPRWLTPLCEVHSHPRRGRVRLCTPHTAGNTLMPYQWFKRGVSSRMSSQFTQVVYDNPGCKRQGDDLPCILALDQTHKIYCNVDSLLYLWTSLVFRHLTFLIMTHKI